MHLRKGCSPCHSETDPERMIVGAATHFAVVGSEQRGIVGDGGGGREADHGAVTLGRGAENGELLDGCRSERRRDWTRGVGELVHPTQTQTDVEQPSNAHVEARAEVCTKDGAYRRG